MILICIIGTSLNLANAERFLGRVIRQLIAHSGSGQLELCTKCGQNLLKWSILFFLKRLAEQNDSVLGNKGFQLPLKALE